MLHCKEAVLTFLPLVKLTGIGDGCCDHLGSFPSISLGPSTSVSHIPNPRSTNQVRWIRWLSVDFDEEKFAGYNFETLQLTWLLQYLE